MHRKHFYIQTLLHTEAFTQTLLHTKVFTHRSFYTQKFLHTDAFTHRRFYTQKLLHTDAFIHRGFYTQKLLHTDAFTRRRFYTQHAFTHRSFYTQTLLHTEAFTHGNFYTQIFLHTDAFTRRRFYTQTLLHTDAFTRRSFYTQKLLQTGAFTHRTFYTQTLLHTEAFTHRRFYTQKLLHTSPDNMEIAILPQFLAIVLPSSCNDEVTSVHSCENSLCMLNHVVMWMTWFEIEFMDTYFSETAVFETHPSFWEPQSHFETPRSGPFDIRVRALRTCWTPIFSNISLWHSRSSWNVCFHMPAAKFRFNVNVRLCIFLLPVSVAI